MDYDVLMNKINAITECLADAEKNNTDLTDWDVKKWNIEVNLHAYGSDEWQVVTDEPLEAKTEREVDDMLSPEFLAEHMSVVNEDGESVFVESAEYRIVEIE